MLDGLNIQVQTSRNKAKNEMNGIDFEGLNRARGKREELGEDGG